MRRRAAGWVLIGVLAIALTACSSDGSEHADAAPGPAPITVTSPVFEDGGTIPTRYTCAGAGARPDLHWSAPPAGTKQQALLVFDPDAGGGGFVHYLVYDIEPNVRSATSDMYPGGSPGMNGRGSEGWIPPCPPSGGPHHYQFTVFALSKTPDITYTANVEQFLDGIKGLVIGKGQLTGLYGR